jgi:hypothetical protein
VGSLDLFSDTDLALAADQRKQIRVTIAVPLVPPASSSSSTTATAVPVCRLIPTIEIFDAVTGRTSIVLGGFHHVADDIATPTAAN